MSNLSLIGQYIDSVTASSCFSGHPTTYSLFNSPINCWASANINTNQYISVQFDRFYNIHTVKLQGRYDHHDQYVKSFLLLYIDENNIERQIGQFQGCTDKNSVVVRSFPAVKAKQVILRPQDWHGHISLRWDVLGDELS